MEEGIFIAFRGADGKMDNAWFYDSVDCVRWLRAFSDRVSHIVVLRHG